MVGRSRWLVGSSSSRTSGAETRARASAARRASPPDSVVGAPVAGKAETVQHSIDPVQGVLIVGGQALRDEVMDATRSRRRRFLRQICDPCARLEKAFAVVRQDLPGQQLHEGGFAAAVASDQAHLVAPRDAEIYLLEHRQTAESDRDAHQRDQGRSRCHDRML